MLSRAFAFQRAYRSSLTTSRCRYFNGHYRSRGSWRNDIIRPFSLTRRNGLGVDRDALTARTRYTANADRLPVKAFRPRTPSRLSDRRLKDCPCRIAISLLRAPGHICPLLSLIHISEPTRQAEISYAVFCLKKKKKHRQ